MKKRDWIVILGMLLLAGGLYLFNRLSAGKAGSAFSVTVDGKQVLKASLGLDAVYPVKQEDGAVNLIEVKDGAVSMREANCRDGLCIRQGKTRSPAKNIVCLPHKLVVSVLSDGESGQDSDLDIIVQ
ncbi:MAG: NusG domain II-containing protein [Clostridia bacterium]|nr:NusG domain II-containing protein [Clostridia bacterium]